MTENSPVRRALRLGETLLDVFFPRECPITGETPDAPRFAFLSASGRARLRFIEDECCPRCGAPFPRIVERLGECVCCRGRKFGFGRSRSLVAFDTAAKRLVHAMKYGDMHAAAADLAALAEKSAVFAGHLRGAVLVPVPLFPKKLNERGYNQSRILAKELSRRIPETAFEELIVRVRDTGTQTRLSADARRGNVRGAFAVPEKLKKRVRKTARYVVVDDVFTTGSTLSECALALKKAGAEIVDAATFAHG